MNSMIDNATSANQPAQFARDAEKIDVGAINDHNPQLASEIQTVEESFQDRIDDLAQQIEDTDDPHREMQLEREIMDLERHFDDVQSMVEDAPVDHMVLGDKAIHEVRGAIDDLHATIADSYAELGAATVSSDQEVDLPQSASIDEGVVSDLEGTAKTDESSQMGETESTEGGGEAESSSSDALADTNVEELVNTLSNDPDAFMEEMSNLDPEERNAMMTAVQQQLQDINQMFQMTSQFSQAMHDTQSAVIQNMRV